MKYGLNLLLWTTSVDDSLAPLLEQIKGWGYDGVELPMFEFEKANYEAVGKRLKSLGLGATAVTICTDAENPISPDAKIRDAGLARLKKAVDMCAASGATHLCGPIHSAIGAFSGSGPTADEWGWGKDTLAKAADYAKSNNVTLVCEYLHRFECYFLNCAEDAARFCREVNHPNLKMMYDTFHANIEEKSIPDAIRACADVLCHVHISENDRSTPGQGNIRWGQNFETLKEVGYDGWLMIEAFGLALPEIAKIWRRMFESEEQLSRDGLAFMKAEYAKYWK
jgi:D-psicose/D-tagatose/L-ribulose 3-epimerase